MIFSNSELSALKTQFLNNAAVTMGGAVAQRISGHTALDQCTFENNSIRNKCHNFSSDIMAFQCSQLRVSQSEFVHNATDITSAISINMWFGNCYLLTLKTNLSYGFMNLSSTDKSFLMETLARGWIEENSGLKQEETNYASSKYKYSYKYMCTISI